MYTVRNIPARLLALDTPSVEAYVWVGGEMILDFIFCTGGVVDISGINPGGSSVVGVSGSVDNKGFFE